MTKPDTQIIVGLICMTVLPIFYAFIVLVMIFLFSTMDMPNHFDVIYECTSFGIIAEIFLLIIILKNWKEVKLNGRNNSRRTEQHDHSAREYAEGRS